MQTAHSKLKRTPRRMACVQPFWVLGRDGPWNGGTEGPGTGAGIGDGTRRGGWGAFGGAAGVPSAVAGAAIRRPSPLLSGHESVSGGVSSGPSSLPKLRVAGSNPVSRSRKHKARLAVMRPGFYVSLRGDRKCSHSVATGTESAYMNRCPSH